MFLATPVDSSAYAVASITTRELTGYEEPRRSKVRRHFPSPASRWRKWQAMRKLLEVGWDESELSAKVNRGATPFDQLLGTAYECAWRERLREKASLCGARGT